MATEEQFAGACGVGSRPLVLRACCGTPPGSRHGPDCDEQPARASAAVADGVRRRHCDVCPVCQGRGTVRPAFYGNEPPGTGRQDCRSCLGQGVVWSP